jgi:hypothetical protein
MHEHHGLFGRELRLPKITPPRPAARYS